jgi:multimeric flavodoxin WrbA
MRVLTLLGSAKKKGNTGTVLGWVEDELTSMGHEVERIQLSAKNVNGCLGCAKCREFPEKTGCVQKDDAPEILEEMIKAQVALFASPIYFWGFSSHMKKLIDRGYSLVTMPYQPGHTSLLKGQRQALLVTGADGYENNAEPLFTAFDRIVDYYQATKAGEWYVGHCTTPQELGPSVKDQAVSFARRLVE